MILVSLRGSQISPKLNDLCMLFSCWQTRKFLLQLIQMMVLLFLFWHKSETVAHLRASSESPWHLLFVIQTWLEYLIYYYFAGSRLWWFQVCSEVAYFQVAPKNDSVRSAKVNTRYSTILLSHSVYCSFMCFLIFKKLLLFLLLRKSCLTVFWTLQFAP
jgi:hypothetical protein